MAQQADGSVVVDVDLNIGKADKQLAKLKEKITDAENKLNEKKGKQSAIAAELEAAKEEARKTEVQIDNINKKIAKIREDVAGTGIEHPVGLREAEAELKQLESTLKTQDTATERIANQYTKITDNVNDASASLEKMKDDAGNLQAQITATEKAQQGLPGAISEADKRMEKFSNRVKGLARRVFVFSVITMALHGLRTWLSNVVKTNTQASAAIAKLKGALLTMVQPLVNVIIPAFINLVNVLTRVVSIIAHIVSALFGTTAEESANAAESLYDEQQAISGVSSEAKEAVKSLASFDEINKLVSENAGASGTESSVKPDFSAIQNIPQWLKDLESNISFSMQDILFDWKDLTAEDILAKIITGLTTIAGAIIGFSAGGIGGAALGMTIGAALGILISNLLFNGDGQLSAEEILKSVIVALGMLTGGILGFVIGGPGGAALGVLLGAGMGLAIDSLIFNNDGVLSAEEILQSVIVVLGALTGGILGFMLGGPGGAALGVLLGAGISLAVSKLIFNNDGVLSTEEILSTLIVALGAIVGGIIGFAAGGPGGALLGILIGAGAMMYLKGVIFDAEGKVNTDFLQTLISALDIAVGGAIGFAVGGPGGALIGALIGAGISFAIGTLGFGWDGKQALNTILSLLCDALFIALGGVIGFALGGPGGALLGMAIGAGIKLLINDVSFSDETSGKQAGYDQGKAVAQNVTRGTKEKLGVHFPSTVQHTYRQRSIKKGYSSYYNEIGGNMMQGLANGISEDEFLVTSAIDQILSKIEDGFYEWQSNFIVGFRTFKDQFGEQWKNFWKNQHIVFVTVWNDILATFQSGINSTISSLNSLVRSANSLSGLTGKSYSTLPSIVVQKLDIPKLAQGAVIPPNREFMAVLGDQKSGTNIETPLATMVQAFKQALNESGGGNTTIILEVDGQRFGQVVYSAYNKENRRMGVSLAGV